MLHSKALGQKRGPPRHCRAESAQCLLRHDQAARSLHRRELARPWLGSCVCVPDSGPSLQSPPHRGRSLARAPVTSSRLGTYRTWWHVLHTAHSKPGRRLPIQAIDLEIEMGRSTTARTQFGYLAFEFAMLLSADLANLSYLESRGNSVPQSANLSKLCRVRSTRLGIASATHLPSPPLARYPYQAGRLSVVVSMVWAQTSPVWRTYLSTRQLSPNHPHPDGHPGGKRGCQRWGPMPASTIGIGMSAKQTWPSDHDPPRSRGLPPARGYRQRAHHL